MNSMNTSPRTKLEKLSSQVYTKVRSKFKNNRCFLWSSKAVFLILVWNIIISIGFKSFLDPSLYTNIIAKYDFDHDYYDGYSSVLLVHGLSYGMNALLFLFYPLTGFLADVCWGRYTTVKNSLCFLFWSIVLMIFLAGLAMLGSTTMIVRSVSEYLIYYNAETLSLTTITITIYAQPCIWFTCTVWSCAIFL